MTAPARNFRAIHAAVVGPGSIGRMHAEAIRRAGAILHAVVGRTEASAAAAREELGAERSTADLSLVLSDPAVDVVHICAPNSNHYPMARAALEAGKHVVLEKPLTIAVEEGRELVRLAHAKGLIHAICFNTRFYPLAQEIRARVDRGDFGDVVSVRASVLEDALLEADDWNWRLDPSVGGPSVALSTLGCHLIDLVAFMLGDAISAVCADLRTVHPQRRAEDGRQVHVDGQEVAHLLIRFRGGSSGLLAVSEASAGRRYDYSVEIDGTRQAVTWRIPDGNELWVGRRGAPNEIVLRDPMLLTERACAYTSYGASFREGFGETFVQFVVHVYAAILAGDPPAGAALAAAYPTLRDGLNALCVQMAALASARSGRWESVTHDGESAG